MQRPKSNQVNNPINPDKENKMSSLESLKLVSISMLLVAGLSACDKTSPGPAETAGKKIDLTADEAGKKMSEAADTIGENMNEQSKKVGVAIDDAAITTKIKAAIFAEPDLKTLQISIDTMQGVVTLSGSVDSLSKSNRAKSLAGAVPGVKEVKNQLVIKSK
jgi:hyperosmotically inducible protein